MSLTIGSVGAARAFVRHDHVVVRVGPGWWAPPYPAYYYPAPPDVAVPPPYGPGVPSGDAAGPTTYVQREPNGAPAAPAPARSWYYCASAHAYYPDVGACPEAWVEVPTR
ncbi:MAG TPA: hypothetical protein VGK30_08375 [Candidatus Binatia bacterium]